LSRILDAGFGFVKTSLRWEATVDAVVFSVEPPEAARFEQHLHRLLLQEPASIGS
jgi:hypothetical protein